MNSRSHLEIIFERDGGVCHYCERRLWIEGKHPKGFSKAKASRDHVVPACYGGINHPINYVLACAGCNSKRGHELDWCACAFCKPLLDEFKSSDEFFAVMWRGIMKFNRPVIRKRSAGWKIYMHSKQYMFPSWHEAVKYALQTDKEMTWIFQN